MIQESNETTESIEIIRQKQPTEDETDFLHTGKHKYDTALHSNIYDQIRTIPTGSYNSILNQIDPNNNIATMNQTQINKKLKNNFKGLFQQNQEPISQFQKLPRLINDQNKKLNQTSRNAIAITDGLNLSHNIKGQSVELRSNFQKKGDIKSSLHKFRSHEKDKDPIMKQYNNARKQIKENIERVAAAVANRNSQMQKINESQQNIYLGAHSQQFYQILKSNEDVINKGSIISKQGLYSPNQDQNENQNAGFNTSINIKNGIQRGETFSSLDGQKINYDNSTLAGTNANTNLNHLLKTEYRLNQNSHNGLTNNDSRIDTYLSQLNQANINLNNKNIQQLPSFNSGGLNSTEQFLLRQADINSRLKSENPIHFNQSALDKKNRNYTFSKTQIDMDSSFASNKGLGINYGKGVNYLWQNINTIRDHQITLIDPQKDRIQSIHQKLMFRKNISSGGNSNITQIEKYLSNKFKEIFFSQISYFDDFDNQNNSHQILFNYMNNLNGCFLEIIDSVCSYKIDLGITLQLLVESYNSIFLQQYEVFYKGKLEKEKELDQEILKLQEKQKDSLLEKEKLISMQNLASQAIETKNNEIQRLLDQNNQLEKQIEELKLMIREDKLQQEKINKDREEKDQELEKKDFMAKDYEKQKRIALKQGTSKVLMDPKNISDMKEILTVASQKIDDRNAIAEQLFEITKQLLFNKQVNQKTQTDQACMNNAIIYEYVPNEESESEKAINDTQNNQKQDDPNSQDAKLKLLAEQKGIILNEDDETNIKMNKSLTLKESIDDQTQDQQRLLSQPAIDISISNHIQSQVSFQKITNKINTATPQQSYAKNQVSEIINKEFNIIDDPQAHFNKALRQIGLLNPKRLQNLHELFDKQCTTIKQKKIAESGNDVPKFHKNEEFVIPYKIIAFIQNRILEIEEDSKIIDKYELMPWLQLKDIIFDIYDHRIRNAPEINGSCNTNYCALNEHLLIFYVDKYRNRKKAEDKIVDMLINLRYHYDEHTRAKTFAMNMQMTNMPSDSAMEKLKKEQRLQQDQSLDEDEFGDNRQFETPHSLLNDNEISDNDIFAQEFFLYTYSLFNKDRSQFLELKNGKTWVRTKHHEWVAKIVIQMIKGPSGDFQKWSIKTRKISEKLKNKEGVESDYLDLDEIMRLMLEEYKIQRREFQKELQRTFMKFMESNIAEVDLDTYNDIIKNGLPPPDDGSQPSTIQLFLSFPGNISKIRAYIFSCISSDENTNMMSDQQFVAGCWRYAIENPIPCVSARISLYGNTREIKFQLQEAEKEYGKPIKIDSKQFTSFTMGIAEKKDYKKRNISQLKNKKQQSDEKSDNSEIEAKRRQLVEGGELQRPSIDQFKVQAGLINLKLEFQQQNQKDMDDPATRDLKYFKNFGVKLKISTLQQMVEEQQYLLLKKKKNDDNKDEQKNDKYPILDNIKQKKMFTKNEFGLSKKQIIVPSFETTGKVFGDHFLILRELRYQIDILKQAYYGQMDKKRTWEQVDQIIKVLSVGQTYLDFPVGKNIQDYVQNKIVPQQKQPSSFDQIFQSPLGKNNKFLKSSKTVDINQQNTITPQSNKNEDLSMIEDNGEEMSENEEDEEDDKEDQIEDSQIINEINQNVESENLEIGADINSSLVEDDIQQL